MHIIATNKILLVGLILGVLVALSSCAMAPPDQQLYNTEDFSIPTVSGGEGIKTDTPTVDVTGSGRNIGPMANEVRYTSKALLEKPNKVYICYDSTLSMMGFADIHGSSEYKNLLGILKSTVNTCF